MGTVEGLASMLVDLLAEATWEDRVHILNALLRLLPYVSSDLRSRMQSSLLRLLNLDNPPSLQVSLLTPSSPILFLHQPLSPSMHRTTFRSNL